MRSLLQNSLTKKTAGLMLGAALSLFSSQAFADTFTASSGNWNSAGIWSIATPRTGTNTIPGPNDIVNIQNGVAVTVTGTNQILNCKTLNISSNSPSQNTSLTLGQNTLNAESITLNGEANQTAKTKLVIDNGTLNISGSLLPVYIGTFTLANSTVNFNGTAAQSIPALTYAKLKISNSATATLATSTTASCTSLEIVNGGSFTNTGTLNIGSGISTVTGTLWSNGIVNLAANGSLELNNPIPGGGTVNINDASTVIYAGTTSYTLPTYKHGNIDITNTAGIDLTTALNTSNLNGYLTVRGAGKLNTKGFPITLFSGKAFSVDGTAELILEGNTSLNTIFSNVPKSLATGCTVNYSLASGRTDTNIPAANYGILKVAGACVLANGTTTVTALDLTNGSLNIGTNDLTVNGTNASPFIGASTTNFIKIATGGKVTVQNLGSTGTNARNGITFPIGTTTYTPATITNTGTAQSFSVYVADGVRTNGLSGTVISDKVVNKVWDVSRTAGNGIPANVTLTLQWNTADQGLGFTPSVCVVSHYEAGKWETVGIPSTAATSAGGIYTQTRTGITSFSPFGVGGYFSPLPVELVSFTAAKKNSEVSLNWVTASEKNNTGFEVQSSTDGKNYEAIGFVASQNGNASSAQRYAFTDKAANKEGLVYYRLKQIDLDGTFEFYTAKVVDLGKFASTVNTFPNPFQNQFELNLNATTAEAAQIEVTDMTGKTIYTTTQNLQKGTNAIKVELNNAPAGLYLLKATTGNQTYTNRLVKQ